MNTKETTGNHTLECITAHDRGEVCRCSRNADDAGNDINAYGTGSDDTLPLCILAMRCYCAGHARGNPASEPCDTNEIGESANDEPGEDDYYLSDDERSILYHGKRIAGPVSVNADPCPQDAVMRELAESMNLDASKGVGYFPDVWKISDHGNSMLISVQECGCYFTEHIGRACDCGIEAPPAALLI